MTTCLFCGALPIGSDTCPVCATPLDGTRQTAALAICDLRPGEEEGMAFNQPGCCTHHIPLDRVCPQCEQNEHLEAIHRQLVLLTGAVDRLAARMPDRPAVRIDAPITGPDDPAVTDRIRQHLMTIVSGGVAE